MPGDKNGAKELLNKIAPGGIVPQSWNVKNQTNVAYAGGYRLTTNKPGTWGSKQGSGTLQWGHFTPFETLQFKWNESDRRLIDDSANIPDPGVVTEEPLLGIPGAIGSTISDVPGLIKAITNPALWKRIGIGAAGVVILLLVFVAIMKRDVL